MCFIRYKDGIIRGRGLLNTDEETIPLRLHVNDSSIHHLPLVDLPQIRLPLYGARVWDIPLLWLLRGRGFFKFVKVAGQIFPTNGTQNYRILFWLLLQAVFGESPQAVGMEVMEAGRLGEGISFLEAIQADDTVTPRNVTGR